VNRGCGIVAVAMSVEGLKFARRFPAERQAFARREIFDRADMGRSKGVRPYARKKKPAPGKVQGAAPDGG